MRHHFINDFILYFLDPFCITSGEGNYPITEDNECTNQYYSCSARLFRTIESCPVSATGQYFGKLAGVYQCITGDAPVSCGYPGKPTFKHFQHFQRQ